MMGLKWEDVVLQCNVVSNEGLYCDRIEVGGCCSAV